MKFKQYLKAQLTDFVDAYHTYLFKTISITLIFTLCCFIVMALLVRFSNFDSSVTSKQVSLLSYLFFRYSKGDVYSIVDLSKTLLIFFVSVFSLGLSKMSIDKQLNTEWTVTNFLRKEGLNNILILTGVLIVCSVLDFLLFQTGRMMLEYLDNKELEKYLHGWLFLIRIYCPLMIFGLTTFRLNIQRKFKIGFTHFLFFLCSIWLFNEFVYEFGLLIRTQVFEFIMLPFSYDKQFIMESFLGMFLIAFFFIGYHSAMSTSLCLIDNENRKTENK